VTPVRRARAFAIGVAVACAAAAGPAHGQARPSLEGYTGQLTTPSAWTADEGAAHLLLTDAEDPRFRATSTARAYALTAGLLGWVEAGGRLSEVWSDPRIRDLSFHLKLRLPLELLWPRIPVALAVGSQDEGGAAANFRTRYAVASARAWRLGASVGYGLGPARMEGWFVGGTLALAGWLEVLGDWDGDDLAAGVRASVPLDRLGLPLRVGGIVRTVLRHEPRQVEWGLTLEVPLWLNAGPEGRHPIDAAKSSPPQPAAAPPAQTALAVVAASTAAPLGASASAAPVEAPRAPGVDKPPWREALRELEEALLAVGLEEVRAGTAGGGVVIEYENNRFNHDEADALQIVLRQVERAGLAGRPLAVVVKRSGLRVAEISVPAAGDVDALAAEGAAPRWRSAPPERRAEWVSPGPRNRRALHTALAFAPDLRTFVGTEVGLLDYVLSLRADLIVPLWPGLTGIARGQLPLIWSDSLDDGHIYRRYRTPRRLEYALLHQAVPLAPGLWVMVGGGVFQATDAGGLAEALWAPSRAGGALALGVQGLWTQNDQQAERRALTASARLRVAPAGLTLLVRYGRFVNGDHGTTAELSRWFGDTQVGVWFTRTEASIAGAFFSIPLTPRRDMRPGWLQVRGAKRWGHGLGSIVGEERNAITVGLGVAPISPWNLDACYLDGGRISQRGLVDPVRALPALSR
jgi:hypothetical protein